MDQRQKIRPLQVDKNLYHELARLARENLAVVIWYCGDGQPETKRQILPVSVSGNRVRARNLASDEVKFFSLDKIEIVPEDYLATEYVRKKAVNNRTTNLLDVLKKEVEELQHLGWEVKLTEESINFYTRANIDDSTGRNSRTSTKLRSDNYDSPR